MSNILNDLHTVGINPFAVTLVAESLLKGPLAAHSAKEPLGFFFPVKREDCAGFTGVSFTLQAVQAPSAETQLTPAPVQSQPAAPTTPANRWRAAGEPDPHGTRYDCERAALAMGHLTDDALANGAFMNYDVRPSPQEIIAGTAHSPIAWMTAVKDRIRWLSRSLEKASAAPQPAPLTAAARDVLAERRRQVEAEGWTPEHDDDHGDGSLALAAACYADKDRPDGMCPGRWPWHASDWKPKDRRADLVRAGALILAEIERLDRASAAPKEGGAA